MAVQAGTSQQKAVIEVVICFLTAVCLAGMAGRRMALLAQRGRPLDQHGLVVAAVRPVAQGAVLGSRRVFPQEWPAFFGMAQIAGQIDARALQQEIVVAIVRVVATAAGHAAEPQWMAAGFKGVGAFLGMAGKTGFLLHQGIENPVAFCVDLVAGGTGQVFTLVGTAEPGQPPPGFMTAQAHLVLFGHRRRGAGSEGDRGIAVLAPALGARMFLAGPMAGFALQI